MNTLDTYIVYLDDATYAGRELEDILRQPQRKRFILVACAPRMTRRIGKWLSHSARENWRDKWCDKLFEQFVPMIAKTDHVFCEVATGPLDQYSEMLLKELGHARIVDARRPKFGVDLPPVTAQASAPLPQTERASAPRLQPRGVALA